MQVLVTSELLRTRLRESGSWLSAEQFAAGSEHWQRFQRVKAQHERLLREYPSAQITQFRWNLAHLKLRADTAQRRYFCEYA